MNAGYTTFSAFPHARGVDTRLAGRYIPRFDELLLFCRRDTTFFPFQQDVTRGWQERLDSVVAAVEWCILSRECTVVLVLLEDDEFGRDVKWYFSPGADAIIDVKDAIVLVEQFLDVACAIACDPALGDALHRSTPARARFTPGTVARSSLFCYAINAGVAVPPALVDAIQAGQSIVPAGGVFARAGDALLSWHVLARVVASVVEEETGFFELVVDMPGTTFSTLQEHVLAIAATQLGLLARLAGLNGGVD